MPFTIVGRAVESADLHGCPTLILYVGRDRHSSGVSLWLRTPSKGRYAHTELRVAERWRALITDEESAIVVAIQALQSRLGVMRGLQPDPGQDAVT